MDLKTLNARFSRGDFITFKTGPNGFPIAYLSTPHASAAITPYGAHLLSYRFETDSSDLLYVSENAIFEAGTAIRGGVPVCWPWFGPDPKGKGRSDHGLARTRMWEVVSTDIETDHSCSITFSLHDTPETLSLWPHPFDLRLKLTVADRAIIELTSRNTGHEPFELTQALHTYFRVGNIAQTLITGLEGNSYYDKVLNTYENVQNGSLSILSETDRVYTTHGQDLFISDSSSGRTIGIQSKGSFSSIVWNPWKEVCLQKKDLNDSDYQHMVCIETSNAGTDTVTLKPGDSHTLVACYSLT